MQEHLSRELWRAVLQGWRDPGDVAALALAHLFELCPHCRGEFELSRDEQGNEVNTREGRDCDAVLEQARSWNPEADYNEIGDGGRRRGDPAASRARELLALPVEQQVDWIRTEKHSGSLLAEALIERCRQGTPRDPYLGVHLANLARIVLQHAPTRPHTPALYARALAYLANAVRVVGDLPRADQILGDARYFLKSQGAGGRILRAELDSLEGSLRNDQCRPADAVPVLLRALLTHRLEGDRNAAAASLLKLAKAHGLLREDKRALQLVREAENELDEDADLRLTLLVRESAGVYLRGSGKPQSAKAVYEQTQRMAEELADPLQLSHRAWCQGRICVALGDPESAESLLLQARDGFAEKGIPYRAALVSLDLAKLYARESRAQEAEKIVSTILPAFQERSVQAKVTQARALLAPPSRR